MKSGRRTLGAAGFSLVELILCIGILTTGIVFVVEIFSSMLTAATKGADWTVATYIASAQLDKLTASPPRIDAVWNNADANGVYQPPPIAYNGGAGEPVAVASVNNIKYYLTYTISKANINSSYYPTGTSRQIYDVDCLVQWYLPSPPATTLSQVGKISMHLSRLIYVH